MARPKLSRATILEAALTLAEEGGIERITARELSQRLGVTPMALYRHVDGIGAIVDELLEHVVARAGILDHATPELEAWLVETFTRIHACLVRYPSILPLLGTSAGFGREALAVVDAVLGRLATRGLEPEASVALFHGFLAYTLGAASLEARAASAASAASAAASARSSRSKRAAEPAFGANSLEGLPNVRRVMPVLRRFTRGATFADGLVRLVRTGLEPPREPTPSPPVRARGPRASGAIRHV